ncbi:glycolate oxidase iron-sulfur subunit [Candidatus Methylacidiphilum fumarolicum]|uniref:Glycolate oxidase iron-sulfur subunit n=2 Tax=Candidatus Methylacidiphilum fumarolicum TaxID=591154 RepID=I0JWW8_METFB|nr:glycolate oxidase subunit GlcF [Candidatus Methylacidiphilum fumarolicum]MBW6414432.1 glycolate oxidase subunit GlcF [Candidatus Methylacidiphilum fumarolicum]TFE69434.1 glycolate dehydrogenase [Candidatus Methylacidiphilum fumarolicum]TFE72860.1 glycolate oxidase iron-sulfur subunit [Candidatus Methylacidiphilum fumarolicum]TFE74604.1 glycolate oxidase iron-sulfur subunit [Candidatus Methylacidiphilum fumarolicum]TFE77171.1 glycolate dehydrogenase [Candidatus Methylacidiphilum fumarolicum]
MDTQLHVKYSKLPVGKEAKEIIKACVHCGFCNATCPTYQLISDELDGPRGRIYLIKAFLEGKASGEKTRMHLDRCLLCQGCETTCPSNVQFGRLADIGKELVEQVEERPFLDKAFRWLLLYFVPERKRFFYLFKIGNLLRAFLPKYLRSKLPNLSNIRKGCFEQPQWIREKRIQMILFKGCVEPVLYPSVFEATRSLFSSLGIQLIDVQNEGCCGALAYHLSYKKKAKEQMKNNIDLWTRYLEKGINGIVVCSSACCQMIKDYGVIFNDDPVYKNRALKIATLTFDPVEILEKEELPLKLATELFPSVAFHSPCTLQHGMKMRGRVEALLKKLGIHLIDIPDNHICCGAAGAYALFQKDYSQRLLDIKIKNILSKKPGVILTANVGCRLQLQSATTLPVLHWIEYLDSLRLDKSE